MKKATGDWLVKILSREDKDDEIIELLKLCDIEKIDLGSLSSKYYFVEKFNIELEFSSYVISEKESHRETIENVYLQHVSFEEACNIALPFGLKSGDSTIQTREKMVQNAKPVDIATYFECDDFLLEDNEKRYRVVIIYSDDKRNLNNLLIQTLDRQNDDRDTITMAYKISEEEALEGKCYYDVEKQLQTKDLEKVFESYNTSMDSSDMLRSIELRYSPKINAIFDKKIKNIEPDDMLNIIQSIDSEKIENTQLFKNFFVHIFNASSEVYKDKKEILTYLFFYMDFVFFLDTDIHLSFGDNFPYLIQSPDDENIEILNAIFLKILEVEKDHKRKRLTEIYATFYITCLNFDTVFDFVLEQMQHAKKNNDALVEDALFYTLFSEHTETRLNATTLLSQEQIERYLEFVLVDLVYPKKLQSIANPKAKPFLLDKLYSKEVLDYVIANDYEYEVNDYIRYTLEALSQQSDVFYLYSEEFDNNWNIFIYDNVLFEIMAKEAYDYEVLSRERKDFKDFQEALQYAKKREREMKKKGYKDEE